MKEEMRECAVQEKDGTERREGDAVTNCAECCTNKKTAALLLPIPGGLR